MYKSEVRELKKVAKSTEMIWNIATCKAAKAGTLFPHELACIARHADKIDTIIYKFLNGPTHD